MATLFTPILFLSFGLNKDISHFPEIHNLSSGNIFRMFFVNKITNIHTPSILNWFPIKFKKSAVFCEK